VIIEYGVGIDSSRITVNASVKCDVKNESESIFWIKIKLLRGLIIIVTIFGRQLEI
jgi:hypothetical protein